MTKVDFARHMAKLAAAYRERIEEATLEVYYDRLRDCDPELGSAVDEVIEDLPRFPAVADLRIRALRIRRESRERMPRLPPVPDTELPVKELMADLKEKMGWPPT